MVMIVKDHEKQAHGFISVTRRAWQPADLRAVHQSAARAGRHQLTAVDWPWVRKARTLAFGLHPCEQ
jgi:hypothetical protein